MKNILARMKIKYSVIVVVLLVFATVYAAAYLDYFQGRSEGDDIKLEWKTREETNLDHFVIERKTLEGSYSAIATIEPKGSNSYYSYIDQSAYKPTDLVFIYRLAIVDNDGQVTHSREVTISHSVSGVKRTWGSIKAMFR